MKRFFTLLLSALPLTALWLGCADTHASNPVPVDPTTLPPPAQGEGFQLKVDSFDVPAGVEEQDCYFFKVGDLATANGLPVGQPVNLHRVQTVQKEGSHHMNIFRVRTIVNLDPTKGTVRGTNGAGECFKSPNWADWPLVANTQQKGDIDWTYPDGVANVMQPDEWLMLQTHYVNATTQKVPDAKGAVSVNFYTAPVVTTLVSNLSIHHDYFFVQVTVEPTTGTLELMGVGILAPGTQAAGYLLSAVIVPSYATYTDAWYVYEWTDTNSDSMAGAGDTFTLVAHGK